MLYGEYCRIALKLLTIVGGAVRDERAVGRKINGLLDCKNCVEVRWKAGHVKKQNKESTMKVLDRSEERRSTQIENKSTLINCHL